MELGELFTELLAEPLADVLAEILAEILADVVGRTELKAQVEIRQPKELKAEELEVFNSLRLSIILLIAVCY